MTNDPYAASEADTSQGRVFTVTGQDWDAVVEGIGSGDEPTSASSSTWARSTRRPTACSG